MTITATAPSTSGGRLDLGSVTGTVRPARCPPRGRAAGSAPPCLRLGCAPIPGRAQALIQSRDVNTQNSLPSGSASTTHGRSPWPTSTLVAPSPSSRATSAA